ncbi:hypothetical protein ACFL5C_00280 [Candidatus Omnitrophota bacterium]
MKFEDKYFGKFKFTAEQVKKNLQNAARDVDIAQKDEFLDVKFNYTYTALLKLGITLLSFYQRKTKSVPGHHVKIIDKLSEILKDEDIADLGNVMRSKRNRDLYDGGIEVTSKECEEYIVFVKGVLERVRQIIEGSQ